MKIVLITLLALTTMYQQKCNKQKATTTGNCYKGRLEVKGICSNYTIALLEGNIDTSRIVDSWTDETTSKTYKNVFALGSPCSFPDSIQAGQSFYFVVDSVVQNCMVCQAYYPKPSKSLSIKVLSQPCQ